MQNEIESVGSCEALLSSMTTLRDGSLKVSFEVNPAEIKVINRLMELYLINEKLFTLGIARSAINKELSDV
jgi:glutathione synthase/RimK-type ligase-like ATP-grasp enzyme